MEIRIVNVPPGEAPKAIRQAWVGLVLPLAPGEKGPRAMARFGVLTGPRHLLDELWRRLTGRYTRGMQYAVSVDAAIAVLGEASPEAAAWWRENASHVIGKRRTFWFAAEACEELADPDAPAGGGGH